MRRSILAGLLSGAGLALLTILAAGLYRVPDGSIGVEAPRRRPEASVFTGPGLRFHWPFLERSAVYETAPVRVEARLPRAAPGGGTPLPVAFWLAAPRAYPAALLAHAPDGDLAAGARAFLEDEAGGPVPLPASRDQAEAWLVARLEGLGLVEGSLRIGSPGPSPQGQENGEIAALAGSYRGPPHPVLVIGLDGADWDVIEPLLRRGSLPVLAGLRERGAWGVLRSMRPTLSPLLWTTVATGRSPDEHGILDFLVVDPATGAEIPITSRHRRAAALWNIMTALGQPSLVVGWWATWPAEAIDGLMVTDRVAYSLFRSESGAGVEGAVWPPGEAKRLQGEVVRPDAITLEEVRRIIDLDEASFRKARAALGDPASWKDPAGHLLRILASTRTYHRIALEEIRRGQPPLTLVYYQGIDEVGHRFGHYAPPAMEWTDPARRAAYAPAVERFYRYQDGLVGELLEAAAPDTRVLLLSDHGFAWGDGRPTDVPPDIEGKPGRWHTLDGILLAAGPGIAPGRLSRDPGLLDVAPTILALLGLPASREMPGGVIEAIAGSGSGEPRIASWEGAQPDGEGGGGSLATGVDEEMLARLRALGYIGGDTPEAGTSGTATGHLNRGNALLSRGDPEAARPEFEAALEMAPGFVPARLGLAQSLLAAGEEERGWKELEQAVREGEGLDPALYMKIARFYFERKEPRRGAGLFASLPRREGLEAARLIALAILKESAGDEVGAEEAARRGLQLDPGQDEGIQLMYDLLTRRGDLDGLTAILEAALRARPGHTEATSYLALTLERQGRAGEALELLRKHLESHPRSLPTLTNLAGLLARRGDDRAAVPIFRRALLVAPGSVPLSAGLIGALGRLGDVAGAREAFDAVESAGDRVELLNALGFALQRNGESAQARKLLERSLRIRPGQSEVTALLSTMESTGPAPPGV